MDLPPQRIVLLGLLATPTAVVFAVSRGEPAVGLAVVNVLIIVGSLVRATSGETGTTHRGSEGEASAA
ncbi:hypothetical protein [Halopenitus persicus]|uniref:DUF8131 domain-containing protein n=1 Tax=Halopenitus persicus TaxID=1048396 RepID=A0A1H3FVW5_9EURY|nr:hypothetical protein [Halopenitus persicus]QHS16805.1 hypothetical protein GWK26_06405 [haloarchaeon 3A1-DGR]SDX95070.1 hypothetical protein SAMN05216564_102228 [Halopenitus persicus]